MVKNNTKIKPVGEKTSTGFSMSTREHTSNSAGRHSCPCGLPISQILNSFPNEARELVPRNIARLNRLVAPYEKWVVDLHSMPYSDFDKWFIVQASRCMGAPIKELNQIEKLRKLKRFMNGGADKMPVTQLDIEKAREVPIESIIDSKKIGSRHFAQCPFHGSGAEKTPSMIINSNNTFHCFSCQEHGDSISFVMKSYNLNFINAIKLLTTNK